MNLNTLYAFALIALTSSCHAAPEMSMQAKNLRLEISSILDETSLRKESDFAPYMIYSNDRFLETYRNPCKHIDAAMEIISSKSNLDNHEEIILSNMLYDLPLGEYFDWIIRTITAYDNKLVSLPFLKRVAFPPLTQRADLYLAYKADKAQKLYKILEKHSDFSSRSKEILSGETASWLINYFSGTQMKLPIINPNSQCKRENGKSRGQTRGKSRGQTR